MGWWQRTVEVLQGAAPAAAAANEGLRAVREYREHHRAMVAEHDARGEPLLDDPENDPETAEMLQHYQAGGEPRSTMEGYWHAHWQREAQGGPPTAGEMEMIEAEGRAGWPTPDPGRVDDMAAWRARYTDTEHGSGSGRDPIAGTRDYESEPELWPAHERQGVTTEHATVNASGDADGLYVGGSRGVRPMTPDEAAQAADIARYVTEVMGSPEEAAEVLADAKWYSSPAEADQDPAEADYDAHADRYGRQEGAALDDAYRDVHPELSALEGQPEAGQ